MKSRRATEEPEPDWSSRQGEPPEVTAATPKAIGESSQDGDGKSPRRLMDSHGHKRTIMDKKSKKTDTMSGSR